MNLCKSLKVLAPHAHALNKMTKKICKNLNFKIFKISYYMLSVDSIPSSIHNFWRLHALGGFREVVSNNFAQIILC